MSSKPDWFTEQVPVQAPEKINATDMGVQAGTVPLDISMVIS